MSHDKNSNLNDDSENLTQGDLNAQNNSDLLMDDDWDETPQTGALGGEPADFFDLDDESTVASTNEPTMTSSEDGPKNRAEDEEVEII